MPVSKSLNAYGDVRLLLDKALSSGGLSFRLPSRNRAITMRSRIYNYLTLWRKHERERLGSTPAAEIPATPYDDIVARIDKADPCVIHLTLRQEDLLNEITDLDGNRLDILPRVSEAQPKQDDLDEAIAALARDAGLELD